MKKEVHTWTLPELEKMEAEPEKYATELAEVNKYWVSMQRDIQRMAAESARLPMDVAAEAEEAATRGMAETMEAATRGMAETMEAARRAFDEVIRSVQQSELYQLYVENREVFEATMPEIQDLTPKQAYQLLKKHKKYLACKARSAPRKKHPASRYASKHGEWLRDACAALKGCQVATSAGRKRVAIKAIMQIETKAKRRTISAFVRDHWPEIDTPSHTGNP